MIALTMIGVASAAVVALNVPAARAAPAANVPASFTQCAACHSVKGGQNGVGPSLFRVMGRKAGVQANFRYSAALKGSKLVWDRPTLMRYLANPAATVPGTTMPDPGLTVTERNAVVNYLAQVR
jgi:cytochrome c